MPPYVTRTNLVINPSVEDHTIGYGTTGSLTLSTFASGFAGLNTGNTVLVLNWATNSAGAAHCNYTVTGLTNGVTYTVSVYAFVPTTNGVPVTIGVSGKGTGTSTSLTNTVQRLSMTFTASATSHIVQVSNTGSTSGSKTTRIDGLFMAAEASLLPYFDGDMPGATWTGGVSASTSTFSYDTNLTPALPRTIVEIDAKSVAAGEFLLGTSALDGTAVLTRTHRWVVVPRWMRVSVVRGRVDENSAIQPGQCTLTVDANSGDWDMNWNSSAYMSPDGVSYLQKGAWLRVTEISEASGVLVCNIQFTGRISNDYDLGAGFTSSVQVIAKDDTALLSTFTFPTYPAPIRKGDTVDQRCAFLATVAATLGITIIPITSAINNHFGSFDATLYGIKGGTTLLAELLVIQNAWGGNAAGICLRADVNNNIVFLENGPSGLKITDTISTLTSDADAESFTFAPGNAQVINAAVINRGSNTDVNGVQVPAQSAVAITSVGQFGPRPPITVDVPFIADATALQLAQVLAYYQAQAQTRASQLVINMAGGYAVRPLLCGIVPDAVLEVARTYHWGNRIDINCNIGQVKIDVTQSTYVVTLTTWPVYPTISPYGAAWPPGGWNRAQ